MSTIDYSKWDNIDCSSSDDDDEGGGQPRVTRLDAPSRVTRTADGSLVVEDQPKSQPTVPALPPPPMKTTSTITTTTNDQNKIKKWTQNGSQETTSDGLALYWSQDRYTVTIRLTLPSSSPAISGKDLQVELKGVYSFQERFSAVGNDTVASIKLLHKDDNSTRVLLEGEFPHPIHALEDSVEADYNSDWEIDRHTSCKYWVMTFQKARPMEGVIIWWKRPLQQFDEIDATQANPNLGKKNAAHGFQQAWEEAHRQFRDNVKTKPKHQI